MIKCATNLIDDINDKDRVSLAFFATDFLVVDFLAVDFLAEAFFAAGRLAPLRALALPPALPAGRIRMLP